MLRRSLIFIGSIVVALAVGGATFAQGMTGGELPRIEPETLREITELLQLDGAGRTVAEAIYAQYCDQYQSARNAMGSYGEWSMALNPWTFGAEDREVNRIKNEQWNRFKPVYHKAFIDLEEQFITDLTALSAVGREEVEGLRRQRFRDWQFGGAMGRPIRVDERIGGIRLDLIRLLDELGINWRDDQDLGSILATWDVQQHELLFRRTYEPSGADHPDWWKVGPEARAALADGGIEAAERPLRRISELISAPTLLSYQIRTLNRQTANLVLPRLDGEAAIGFRENVDADFAPSIYEACAGITALEKALALHDLSADQRADVDNLAQQYRLERRSAVERILPAVDRLLTPEELLERNMWHNNLLINEEREYFDEKMREHEAAWAPVTEQIEAWKLRDAQYLQHSLRILTPEQRKLIQ